MTTSATAIPGAAYHRSAATRCLYTANGVNVGAGYRLYVSVSVLVLTYLGRAAII